MVVAASPPPLHLALPLLLFAAHAAVGSAAGAVAVSSGGQLWCVAKNNAEDGALQSAIDWACGPNGGADCRAIQLGGACYEPPDLLAHASYAFNDYFLRSGGAANPASCDFSGAAELIGLNPTLTLWRWRLGAATCFFLQVMGTACFLPVHPPKTAASQEQQAMVRTLQI